MKPLIHATEPKVLTLTLDHYLNPFGLEIRNKSKIKIKRGIA